MMRKRDLQGQIAELQRQLNELKGKALLVEESSSDDPFVNLPSGVEFRCIDDPGTYRQFLMSQGSGLSPKWTSIDPLVEVPAIDYTQDYPLFDTTVQYATTSLFYMCPARQFPSGTSAKFTTPTYIVNFETDVRGAFGLWVWSPPRSDPILFLYRLFFTDGVLYYTSGGVPMQVVQLDLRGWEFGNLAEDRLLCSGLGLNRHYGNFRISNPTYANKALISQGATPIEPSPDTISAHRIYGNLLPAQYSHIGSVTATAPAETMKVDLGAIYTLARASVGMWIYANYGSVSFEYSTDDVTYTVIESWAAGETGIVFPYADNISARYLRVTQAGDGTNATNVRFYKLFAWA